MTTFADSSALVKRYVTEPGQSDVRATDEFTVSALSRVEVVSAVRRKQRFGELRTSEARAICSMIEADFDDPSGGVAGLSPVGLTGNVLRNAAALLGRHALSAADAVQLSSAMLARDADPGISTFACFDIRLRRAAELEGFRLLPRRLPVG